ncbi:calcium/sodium antiporter [bacterium]|nr:calcium/sodium antiporter [bacterium]
MITLVLSLAVVTLGAEALVRGASALALRAGVSPLFIGLTIVGFGTSTPELAASLAATTAGSSDVAVGNVVGSGIFNIAVILGLAATFRPIRIRLAALRRDLIVAILAACLPWLALATGGILPRWLGLAFVAALGLYLHVAYRTARRETADQQRVAEAGLRSTVVSRSDAAPRNGKAWMHVLFILAGLALLAFGSRVFVASALDVAQRLGMSELFIGLTIVAAGTSLPELVTSIVAAARNSPDIAVGNVIGSNIFNMFGILGIAAVVSPQTVHPSILLRDTPLMLAATLALIPILRSGGVVSRWEGGLLLAGYAVYLGAMLRAG